MKYEKFSRINDCYLIGHGELRNICNPGIIETVEKDYIVIRDLALDEPIFIKMGLEEFNQYFNDL